MKKSRKKLIRVLRESFFEFDVSIVLGVEDRNDILQDFALVLLLGSALELLGTGIYFVLDLPVRAN